MHQRDHYPLLDAARGIAAVSVVLYHLLIRWFPDYPFPFGAAFLRHSYLAVDLFFVMSGLVIARSYEAKLHDGTLSFRGFCKVRLIRLWPLYLLGITIGFAFSFARAALMHQPLEPLADASQATIVYALNLFFIPSPYATPSLFPFNAVAWTLCYEIAINLLYALTVRRLNTRVLGIIMLLAASVILLTTQPEHRLDLGWGRDNMLVGIARIFFSFPLGILLYRWRAHRPASLPHWAAPLLLLALLLLLTTPYLPFDGWNALYYDWACVFTVIPAFVLAASLCRTPAWLAAPSLYLGQLSYPLYITHYALMAACAAVYKQATHLSVTDRMLTAAPIMLVMLLVFAHFAGFLYDAPLRRRLSR